MMCAIDNSDGVVVVVAEPDTKLADLLALVPMGDMRSSRRWRKPNKLGAEHGEIGVHVYRLASGVPVAVGDRADDLHGRDAFKGRLYIGFAEIFP